jgi:very-short-patch-repair endonuclease
MGCKRDQTLWAHARKQHGVVARWQLVRLGFTRSAIEKALKAGRLHRTEWRGVYSVGRPGVSAHGRLMGAVLSCGDSAVLSHQSAGALWRISAYDGPEVFLSVPAVGSRKKRKGMTVHRRNLASRDLDRQYDIPVTSPTRTIIDLSAGRDRATAERLINRADARNLVRADTLRAELEHHRGERGVPLLLAVLDRDAFVVADSDLERLFVPLALRAGLPKPHSQRRLGRGRVDFWFPTLNLVVECDSLRYHRTKEQQAEDRARDHEHLLAGRTYIRFTHHQVARDPEYVIRVLVRLRAAASSTPSGAFA